MQGLSQYFCDFCDPHSETFISLPDVPKSDLEKEVKNMYIHGTVSGLVELLGLEKKDMLTNVKEEQINSGSIDKTVEDINKGFEMVNPENIQRDGLDQPGNGNNEDPLVDTECVKNKQEKIDDMKVEEMKDIKEEKPKIHSFELIPCKRKKESRSPGILIINSRFKYFYNSEWHGRYTYQCVHRRLKNCQARALVQRDDTTGEMRVARCATDDEHNHEGMDNVSGDADIIVKKMKREMAEMIKVCFSFLIKNS